MTFFRLTICFACVLALSVPVMAQETPEKSVTEKAGEVLDEAKEKAGEVAEDTRDKVDEIAKQVDENEDAQEISAGILQPIYRLAEQLAFPAFHWLAFAIMATGVVSYALQLVLTKFVLLLRASLSLSEVLSDALGLVISVVGLVLTTQAATENSEFTRSSFAVISASAVGLIVGFIFYRWGHKQETQALKGRKVERMGSR